jgi:hypothetical protein
MSRSFPGPEEVPNPCPRNLSRGPWTNPRISVRSAPRDPRTTHGRCPPTAREASSRPSVDLAATRADVRCSCATPPIPPFLPGWHLPTTSLNPRPRRPTTATHVFGPRRLMVRGSSSPPAMGWRPMALAPAPPAVPMHLAAGWSPALVKAVISTNTISPGPPATGSRISRRMTPTAKAPASSVCSMPRRTAPRSTLPLAVASGTAVGPKPKTSSMAPTMSTSPGQDQSASSV